MRYPGGKNGSGVYQRLISMMPPHDVYIELFLGSGAVMRRKRFADVMSYGYELNPETIREFESHFADGRKVWRNIGADAPLGVFEYVDREGRPILHLANTDAIAAIRERFAASSAFWLQNDPARTVIYADPPYLIETRKSKGKIYQYEMFGRAEHTELLDLLAAVPCKVMISGYESPLYNRKLKDWRKEEIPTVNRAGDRVIETVWLNFPEPFELHDYEHVGENYRDRWRIEKRARRWVANFLAMPAAERYAIYGRLADARAEHIAAEQTNAQAAQDRRESIAKRRDKQNRRPSTPEMALGSTTPAEPVGLFD